MPRRVDHIEPAAHHGHGWRRARRERALVGRPVDTEGQARDDPHSRCGEVVAHGAGHVAPIPGATAGADDRHPRAGQDVGSPPVEQHDGRFEVIGQRWRVRGRSQDRHADAGLLVSGEALAGIDPPSRLGPSGRQGGANVPEGLGDLGRLGGRTGQDPSPRLVERPGPSEGREPGRPHAGQRGQRHPERLERKVGTVLSHGPDPPARPGGSGPGRPGPTRAGRGDPTGRPT